MIATLDHYSTLAKSYNTLDFSAVSEIMDDDIVFLCKYFEDSEPVIGKAEVMKTIRQIFTQLREAKPTVQPQLAIVGDQSKSRCQLGKLNEGDQCILFVKDSDDARGAVCVVRSNADNKMVTIDIFRILQRLTAIEGTYMYPK